MITDVLFTSPILGNPDAGADVNMGGGGAPAGNNFAEYGGINPDLDPDLAMALKVSMEEERARQKKDDGEPAAGTAQNAGAGDM